MLARKLKTIAKKGTREKMNTIKHDSIEAQNISRDFVRTEVYANVGVLVEYILRKSYEDNDTPFSYEDFQLEVDPTQWGAFELNNYLDTELGTSWEDVTGKEWENVSNDDEDLEEQEETARDYIRENAPSREVLEWWAVSDWLLSQLESEGEIVAHVGGNLNIWGRQTTGQAIKLDYVIQKIALERYEKLNQ